MGEQREGRSGGPLSAGDDSVLSRDIANIVISRGCPECAGLGQALVITTELTRQQCEVSTQPSQHPTHPHSTPPTGPYLLREVRVSDWTWGVAVWVQGPSDKLLGNNTSGARTGPGTAKEKKKCLAQCWQCFTDLQLLAWHIKYHNLLLCCSKLKGMYV